MCDSVKAVAAATGKLDSEWLEKEISKYKNILKYMEVATVSSTHPKNCLYKRLVVSVSYPKEKH